MECDKEAFYRHACSTYNYVDDLSVHLNNCKVGCRIGDRNINHLMYADDLVIISPSVAGLAKLLNMCEAYGVSHDYFL